MIPNFIWFVVPASNSKLIKENFNSQMKAQDEGGSTITVPDGVDAELLMKVLGNPEMAALFTSLAKTMKV